jgi:hypothetical protein
MSLTTAHLLRLGLSATSLTLFAASGILALMLYLPWPHPYVVKTPVADVASMEGEILVVTRWFTIRDSFIGTAYRELVKVDDVIQPRWELPGKFVELTETETTQTRLVMVGHLPPGRYHFRTTLCWSVNFLRKDCTKLPVLEFNVEPD